MQQRFKHKYEVNNFPLYASPGKLQVVSSSHTASNSDIMDALYQYRESRAVKPLNRNMSEDVPTKTMEQPIQ